MILEKIAAHTKKRIADLKSVLSFEDIENIKKQAQTMAINRSFAFEKALKTKDIALICEVKRASPSKGIISEKFDYLTIAKDYENAGANAISVLTEPEFFKGSDLYLREIKKQVSIPVLRKDFTIDSYQIYEAKIIGADAILLICALLDTVKLKEYIKIADRLGLSALVEAHTEEEIHSALNAGARMIGVNNRNLHTFEIDMMTSIRLKKLVPDEIVFVSESGIRTTSDIDRLRQNGIDAVLIGETLMRSDDKKAMLEMLRGKP